MLTFLLLWVRAHKVLLEGVVTIPIWLGAFYYYYITFWAKKVQNSKAARAWSVDLATKSVVQRNKMRDH
jgi:hypothetical protein